MPPVRFEEVDTLIIDPDRAQLDVIKMVLRNNGFRLMRLGTSIADLDRKSTCLNSSHVSEFRMPSSA